MICHSKATFWHNFCIVDYSSISVLLSTFWTLASLETAKNTAKKVHAFLVITAFEVIPTVVMPAMYVHISLPARRQARQVATHQTQLDFNSHFSNGDRPLQKTAETGKRHSGVAQQSKFNRRTVDSSSVIVLGAVIGLFVLCWSFDTVISLCTKLELCVISDGLFRVSDLMIFANSAINPLIYALLKKDIKHELSFTCCCTVTMKSSCFFSTIRQFQLLCKPASSLCMLIYQIFDVSKMIKPVKLIVLSLCTLFSFSYL